MESVLCPVVVGRDDALDFVRLRLDAAAGGAGGVLAVVGDAGIGKSRLAREVSAAAALADTLVLTGRASPVGAPVPFGPLTQALLPLGRDASWKAPEMIGFEDQLRRLISTGPVDRPVS